MHTIYYAVEAKAIDPNGYDPSIKWYVTEGTDSIDMLRETSRAIADEFGSEYADELDIYDEWNDGRSNIIGCFDIGGTIVDLKVHVHSTYPSAVNHVRRMTRPYWNRADLTSVIDKM